MSEDRKTDMLAALAERANRRMFALMLGMMLCMVVTSIVNRAR